MRTGVRMLRRIVVKRRFVGSLKVKIGPFEIIGGFS